VAGSLLLENIETESAPFAERDDFKDGFTSWPDFFLISLESSTARPVEGFEAPIVDERAS
jgi:hypothetical protein